MYRGHYEGWWLYLSCQCIDSSRQGIDLPLNRSTIVSFAVKLIFKICLQSSVTSKKTKYAKETINDEQMLISRSDLF